MASTKDKFGLQKVRDRVVRLSDRVLVPRATAAAVRVLHLLSGFSAGVVEKLDGVSSC